MDILVECLKCQTKDFPGMKRSLLALASVFNSNGKIHFVSVLVQCVCRSMPVCQSQNVYTGVRSGGGGGGSHLARPFSSDLFCQST